MKANTRGGWNGWNGWKEAFKPRKKDVDLSKFEKPEWSASDTNCLSTFTEGGFGPLRLVENLRSQEFALEKIVSKDMVTLESFKEAVQCLKICKQENHFLKITAVSENPTSYSLYLEKFNGIPLSYLDGNKMQPWMICTIVSHIGKALRCIHSKGILHRNITGSNILINDNLQAKLTGFELAKISKNSCECVGTIGYMAPEKIAHNYRFIQILMGTTNFEKTAQHCCKTCDKYGTAADYFSLGVVLFDMFFFNPPSFFNLDNIEEYKEEAILLNMYECRISFPSTSDSTGSSFFILKDLIADLLKKNANLRPTGNKLKKHAVLKNALNMRPAGQTFVDLQYYIKPISEIKKASTLKLVHNPSLEFFDNIKKQELEDMFLYLATRPESYPVWRNVIQMFHAQKYVFYKAIWDTPLHPVSTLPRSRSLGFSLTSEQDDSHRSENVFPTPSEPNVNNNTIIQNMDLESEIPDLEDSAAQDLPIDSAETSMSVSEDSFHMPLTRYRSTESLGFSYAPENAEDDVASIYESTTTIIETEETANTELEAEDGLFITIILWIAFITLCIIFLGKSVYSMVTAKKSPGAETASAQDEGSENDSD